MKANTQAVTKEYAAIVQLHDAILLFYNGSYLSSITLAGAAEEILKKLSNEAMSEFLSADADADIQHNSVDTGFTFIAMMMAGVGPIYDDLTDAEKKSVEKCKMQLYSEHNHTRNALKHKDRGEDIVESDDFEMTARKHISSALENYCLYKKKMPTEYPLLHRYCKEFGLSYN